MAGGDGQSHCSFSWERFLRCIPSPDLRGIVCIESFNVNLHANNYMIVKR